MSAKGRNLNATMIEVRKDVVAATGGKQVPWDHSALTGDFYFVPGASAPAPGAESAAPAGTNADVAVLQARLAKLEAEAKAREAAATTSAAKANPAFIVRASNRIEGDLLPAPPSTANCESRCQTETACHGYNLSRDGICELFSRVATRVEDAKWRSGVRADVVAGLAPLAAKGNPIPPVIPKALPPKVSPNFEVAENVGLLGAEIGQPFRAPSPIACREACEKDPSCAGFQHGRKSPVMGQCELFSRIDARREDDQWRSGVRSAAAARPDAKPGVDQISVPLTRKERGFDIYEGALISGKQIKNGAADSVAGCQVVCRNTPGCIAANYNDSLRSSAMSCEVFSQVTKIVVYSRTVIAIVRND